MSYPTPSDYQEAVQDPESAFHDPELQTASPRENVLGLPQPITGAFAAVFPMTTDIGVRYAAKCFLSEVPNQQRRYAAVSEHLSSVDLPWTVAFDYQRRGIDVNGSTYPVLKMEWAEGAGLNRFVDRHINEPDVLLSLADRWLDVSRDLEKAEIAHGDLQHGNIRVVDEDGDVVIRLVDYDTMYVPALSGRISAEVGHRNYQHPDRTEQDFGPGIDRFSALVIYAGLQACAARPELWQAYDTGENLLFRDGDFYDPDSSPLLNELRGIEHMAPLVESLRTACYVEPEDVPSLDDIVHGEASFSGVTARSRSRDRAADPVAQRDTVERLWAPGVVLALVLAVALGIGLSMTMGAVMTASIVVVSGAAAWLRYRRHPVVRRNRRLTREAERISRLIQNVRRQIASLQLRREEVLDSVDDRRAERLNELREEVIYDHLKYHFVGELRDIEGLTHKHVVRLKSANIRTAYEATEKRVGQLRGLADATRARIAMWRATLIRQAEEEMPDELSPAEERRLRRYVEHRVEDIDAEIRRAEEKIEVQSTEHEAVEERRSDLAPLSFGRYLAWLLYLVTLPERTRHAPSRETTSAAQKNAARLPEPAASDGPWWEQH
ncbi:hypothetical protein CRI94_12065 [Longibacter salinarum]|uniref:Protein kinase domain-containing protein n=1 Tax=Longibacter salinarum TaxID=1850348 RepID=A0A2A8CX55_9BACT|nr:hypothetical protein [Longibacter salinarum]PEN12968.1 hypothetical protein CRI94_12065 [Longibacter salinarum]